MIYAELFDPFSPRDDNLRITLHCRCLIHDTHIRIRGHQNKTNSAVKQVTGLFVNVS
jgi:hypothetical protein